MVWRRNSIRLLVLVILSVPALAQDQNGAGRFARLYQSYLQVRSSHVWPQIKDRRRILGQMADLESSGGADASRALPVLMAAFEKDPEPSCRLQAMRGIGASGNLRALKRMVVDAIRDRDDLYTLCLPDFLAAVRQPKLGAWLAAHFLTVGRHTRVRACVIDALGRMKSRAGADAIGAILTGKAGRRRVLYESLIALGRIGGKKTPDVIAPYLHCDDPCLRAAAVRGLAATGDKSVLDRIVPLVADDSATVREAIADAVVELKAKDRSTVLIHLLKLPDLSVKSAARDALRTLTGLDYGLDPGAWKRALARKAGEGPSSVDAMSSSVAKDDWLLSDRTVFIIDASASMTEGLPPRMRIARAELEKLLDRLKEHTSFDVVAMGGSPIWWKPHLVGSSPRNLASAKRFLAHVSPGGGTNLYGALKSAIERNPPPDAVYLIGDGSPSRGRYVDPTEILARVRWMNRLRRVKIHTLAVTSGVSAAAPTPADRTEDEQEATRFLSLLAKQEHGTYRVVKK